MQECTGLPSSEHRAGAAVAGVAALLDLEVAVLAQQGAQALARARVRVDGVAVDRELHAAPTPVRRGSARRARAHAAAPVGGAVRIA